MIATDGLEFRGTIRAIWFVVVTAAAVMCGGCHADRSNYASPTTVINGVRVECVPESADTPLRIQHQGHNIHIAPLTPEARSASLRIVTLALNKYPRDMLSQVEAIRIVRDLTFEGAPASGTFINSTILVVGIDIEHTDDLEDDALKMEWAIHHELASVFMLHNPSKFPFAEWGELDADAKYVAGSSNSNLDDHGVVLDRMRQDGFATAYARSSFSNDISESAAALIMMPWSRTTQRYPLVRRRTELMLLFYHRICGPFHVPN